MPPQRVRAEYDQLKEIAQVFNREADKVTSLNRLVRGDVDALQQGKWSGRNAVAFYREMQARVMPALDRLQRAFAEAALTVHEIRLTMQSAEEEAAALFKLAAADLAAAAAATNATAPGGLPVQEGSAQPGGGQTQPPIDPYGPVQLNGCPVQFCHDSAIALSGFTEAQRQDMARVVNDIAGQMGGMQNFERLASQAAQNAGRSYVQFVFSSGPGSWWDEKTATIYLSDDLFSPQRLAEKAGDITRSYLPEAWRTAEIYQQVTITHEIVHMFQSAAPEVLSSFDAVYQPGEDGFLYAGGAAGSEAIRNPPPAREVEAQALALTIQYGILNNVPIAEMNSADLQDIPATLSGGRSERSRSTDVRPQVISQMQDILSELSQP